MGVGMVEHADGSLIRSIAGWFQKTVNEVEKPYLSAPSNIRVVLKRQYTKTTHPSVEFPVCTYDGERRLHRALGRLPVEIALLTLARIYDEGHIKLCKTNAAARRGKPHLKAFKAIPRIDVHSLCEAIDRRRESVDDQIVLKPTGRACPALKAVFEPVPPMSFDNLEQLKSLSDVLPGESEQSPRSEYAGIGGGGGSDVISASIIGHLLERHEKRMELLVSTRTWATGSQGKKGSKIGVKREVQEHGGSVKEGGRDVSGTFLINANTKAEGRHLESIPVGKHLQVIMVLDQGESTSDIPAEEKAELRDQFRAVIAQGTRRTDTFDQKRFDTIMAVDSGGSVLKKVGALEQEVDTVLTIDTGGDVFGVDATGGTTPDQDYRVQKAITEMNSAAASTHNLVTVVVAPGVDAPHDAPEKAYKAKGKVYKLTEEDKKIVLNLLKEYKMDGTDPDKFGKTTLALQARLKGALGWTSLNLPEYVVDTWDNPWSNFVYIRECMSDIILMPTRELLPLIEPPKSPGSPPKKIKRTGHHTSNKHNPVCKSPEMLVSG